MKRISIIGHFAKDQIFLDGQTIKTVIFTEEIQKKVGFDKVECIDTFGWKKNPINLFFKSICAVKKSKNVLFFTDQGGIKIFPCLLTISNIFGKCKIHYVVIGGWLPEFLKKHSLIKFFVKKLDYIYVETATMKKVLDEQGFENVYIVPNCKKLNVLLENALTMNFEEPYKLCTFSRVMKEKGIEDAVNAVKKINEEAGRAVYILDIYGQVDSKQIEWFEDLEKSFPDYVKYKGCVPYDKSVETLKDYFALLFPTYYKSEGFAGTILDAYASGVPVIASNWRYNFEIIKEKKTGMVFDLNYPEGIINCLRYANKNSGKWKEMRLNCLKEAERYKPENVIGIITSKIQ